MGHHANFFIASAGASAALLGLLVVAVPVVNADDGNSATRERRTVLAGTASSPCRTSLAMAIVGLLASTRLISRAHRAGNFSPALGRAWEVTGITRRE